MESKPNLAKAIIEVMKSVKGVEKNMTVGRGGNSYNGVADKDVKDIIGPAMENAGLCILPIDVKPETTINRWEESYNGQPKQKQSVFTEVTTQYLLLHESGESQVISGYGHGVDTQDKGAGKATTYALKYALLYAFMVPTGKIDDSDKSHSDSLEVPKNTPIKKIMVEGSNAWKRAVTHIAGGGEMSDITNHMVVTKEQQEKIVEQASIPA